MYLILQIYLSFALSIPFGGMQNVPDLYLTIDEDSWGEIVDLRNKFLNVGYIGNDLKNPYFNASIKFEEKEFLAKIRLKGDFTDHISHSNKWSYKIKLLDGKRIMGMNEFSIQTPETRNGFGEWVFYQFLKFQGLIALRYDFVNVWRNEEELGVFAVEERFNNDLLSYNQKVESPIVKFNEDLILSSKSHFRKVVNATQPLDWSSFSSEIDGYEIEEMFKSKSTKYAFQNATSKLEAFRSGTLKAADVFDLDKMGKFYALCDLFGSTHATQFANLRFYLDPVTELLEPIGFDANGLTPIQSIYAEELSLIKEYPFRNFEHRINWLLMDKDFILQYHKWLEIVSSEKFLVLIEKQILGNRNKYKSIETLLGFNWNVFRHNQNQIKYRIYPVKPLHAYLGAQEKGVTKILIHNPHYLPVEVFGLSTNKEDTLFSINKNWIEPRVKNQAPSLSVFPFELLETETMDLENLNILCRIPGISEVYKIKVNPWSIDFAGTPGYFETYRKNPRQFEKYFTLSNKTLILKKPKTIFSNNVIIPEGYEVLLPKGSEINLNHHVFISFSHVISSGTNDEPVIISGEEESSFSIVNASVQSIFVNTRIKGMGNFNEMIKSGVVFYNSPVSIDACEFVGMNSGHAISFYNNEGKISNTLISGFSGDALHGVFSNITVNKVKIANGKSDAVKLEHSHMQGDGLMMSKVGRSINLKDYSEVNLGNLYVEDVVTFLKSIKGSKTKMTNVVFKNVKSGFEIDGNENEENLEFDYSSVEVNNLNSESYQSSIHPASSVVLNGNKQKGGNDEFLKSELQKALMEFNKREFQKCIDLSIELLRYYPQNAILYNNIGASFNELEKWGEAIKYLSKGLEIDPNNTLINNNLKIAQGNFR